jgi:hypothetical protein
MGWSGATDLRSECAAGKIARIPLVKTAGGATGSAGVLFSLWNSAGISGLNGSSVATISQPSTSGRQCENLAGSIFVADTSTETKHILSLSAISSVPIQLLIYDLIVDCGTWSLASVQTHTVNSPTIPRYNAVDSHTQAFAVITTATTTTAPVCSLSSFTNTAGSAGLAGAQTTLGINNARVMFPLATSSGSTGIRSIESFQVHTAASAGECNLMIARQLAEVTVPVGNASMNTDFLFDLTLPERVYDDQSLLMCIYSLGNNTPAILGELTIGWG